MAQPTKNNLLLAAALMFVLALLLLASLFMMNESPVTLKLCPVHLPDPIELPLADFGVSRARADGKNLYCRTCIRRKTTESRRALKEYRVARRAYVRPSGNEAGRASERCSLPLLSALAPVERVREVIRKGARTQREIARETRLDKDEVGDAIAELLLWTREIKTRLVNNHRHYFINNSEQLAASSERSGLPSRQADVKSEPGAAATEFQAKWRAG